MPRTEIPSFINDLMTCVCVFRHDMTFTAESALNIKICRVCVCVCVCACACVNPVC